MTWRVSAFFPSIASIVRSQLPSPIYLQDWGGFQGTGGDSRGLDRWRKTTASASLVPKDVHRQPVREIGFRDRLLNSGTACPGGDYMLDDGYEWAPRS